MSEFIRCSQKFNICGIIFKCDLQKGHSGQCISLPDGKNKLATVIFPKVYQKEMIKWIMKK